jgi:hypothetical protein
VAFGGLLAATVAVGVAVGSGVLTTLLIVLTVLAPAGAVVAWLGALRGWRYPFVKRQRELSPEERQVLAQLGRQPFFERWKPPQSLRRPRR